MNIIVKTSHSAYDVFAEKKLELNHRGGHNMFMKKFGLLVSLVLVFSIVLTGCSATSDVVEAEAAGSYEASEDKESTEEDKTEKK